MSMRIVVDLLIQIAGVIWLGLIMWQLGTKAVSGCRRVD